MLPDDHGDQGEFDRGGGFERLLAFGIMIGLVFGMIMTHAQWYLVIQLSNMWHTQELRARPSRQLHRAVHPGAPRFRASSYATIVSDCDPPQEDTAVMTHGTAGNDVVLARPDMQEDASFVPWDWQPPLH